MSEMRRTGVPASITLAQGIIESDYGRSRLAREANNHFGIKCHNGWKGRKIYHDDDRRNECFRSYKQVSESYYDHSDFLRQGSRYSFLFDLKPDDYKGWARGLKSAGYATNPRYARMLIDMISENNLHIYDQIALSNRDLDNVKGVAEMDISVDDEDIKKLKEGNINSDEEFIIEKKSRVKTRNRIKYIRVRENDTFESLIEEFDLLRWELYRYNDLDEGDELYEGQILYLQPKRKKAAAGNDFHILKEGETMYDVSQLYGIRLKALYSNNRMEPGYEPPAGTELWLRKLKPEGL
ncbi:MAG: glucosaminidase domain-containing protein [Bacteroidales bacterium]|nr:glucosaminidase domain-containing protein [Bacteroidales bacterium]